MDIGFEFIDAGEITPVSPEEFMSSGLEEYESGMYYMELVRAFDDLYRVTVTTGANFTDFAGLIGILRGQSGPPRLCIDGHEYHRRQRRRTKRNRR